ncbi:MAG: hypothetical protein ACRDPA_31740, partial [Solirubrobacteraceae bacterium]
MGEVVRTLAYALLALSAAGGVYSASALAIQAAGPRLSDRARELCWRMVAVKLVGVTIMVMAL